VRAGQAGLGAGRRLTLEGCGEECPGTVSPLDARPSRQSRELAGDLAADAVRARWTRRSTGKSQHNATFTGSADRRRRYWRGWCVTG